MNLLSAAVMQVQADKSEVIAPVLPPVIIRSSSWSHWLFLEALSEQCPALSQLFPSRACPGAAPAARSARGLLLLLVGLRGLLALPPLPAGHSTGITTLITALLPWLGWFLSKSPQRVTQVCSWS